jgi:hypothetical protein
MATKLKSAYLKLGHACECIRKLNEILGKERPFTYVVETDTSSKQRATFAKKNETVIDQMALLCGDTVHNLRTALDHAYWEVVSPFTKTDRERRNTQFPFCELSERLTEAITNRFADRIGQTFVDALAALNPYGESGGNQMLYLIDAMDRLDKHRLLTPIGDYTTLSSDMVRKQVPDFPAGMVNCSFGNNRRDVGWSYQGVITDIGSIVPPSTCVFEKELDVPVSVIFMIAEPTYTGPVIPTLNQMADVVRQILAIMKPFAVLNLYLPRSRLQP